MRSSVKPFKPANDNLINYTLETWQPRADRELHSEDAREFAENAVGFFSLLAEWAQAETPEPANDTGKFRKFDGCESRDDG